MAAAESERQLSAAAAESERQLSVAAAESERRLAGAEAKLQAQSERLAGTETELEAQSKLLISAEAELSAERAARLRSGQRAAGLQQLVEQLERGLQEERRRAATWREESERAADADRQRCAETEAGLRWADGGTGSREGAAGLSGCHA